MEQKISHFSHLQGLQLASLAIIALAIPLGIIASQSNQDLYSSAASIDQPNLKQPTCVLTGCQNELCVDATIAPLESNCSLASIYAACQIESSCTLQTDGTCGFSKDPYKDVCFEQNNLTGNNQNSLINSKSLPTAYLNKPYQTNLISSLEPIESFQIFNLPPGIDYTCSTTDCQLIGTPTQIGQYQLVASISQAGLQEQKLISLTIRAGGTLEKDY
jgi:hypothetical protein